MDDSSDPSWFHTVRGDPAGYEGRTVTLHVAGSDGGSPDGRAFFGLSPGLLQRARRRLFGVGLGMAAINVLGLPVALWFSAPQLLVLQLLGAAAGLGLAGVTCSGLGHRRVLLLGLGFEVLCAALDSLVVPWFIYEQAGYVPVLTWTSLYVVLYPLIIPTPPELTLKAAVAAASMVPLGLVTLDSLGLIEAGAWKILGASVNPALCAGIAVLASAALHGLGREASRAERLGSYLLEARIGAGGMGEVWRASHALLARPAAVKLIRVGAGNGRVSADPEARMARFEAEARHTALLTSPNTVRLYDFGRTEDGRLFFAMELLEGEDLERLVLRCGPLEPARVAQILVQVCRSLREAHERGLIHRDVKPSNLMLCRVGAEQDFVKVLDFGLATRAESSDESATISGTPGFLPPEAIRRGGVSGPRSDLYSLGCTAYFLLTGRLVFEHLSVADMLVAHVHKAPQPPSTFRAIPPELERIVLRCLAKSPDARPASAAALAHALEATGLPAQWTQERAEAWWSSAAEHPDRSASNTETEVVSAE